MAFAARDRFETVAALQLPEHQLDGPACGVELADVFGGDDLQPGIRVALDVERLLQRESGAPIPDDLDDFITQMTQVRKLGERQFSIGAEFRQVLGATSLDGIDGRRAEAA